MSLNANLPISGNSLNVSIANGLTGLIFTIAASPVFKNFGFSSTIPPVLGSILATNSEIVVQPELYEHVIQAYIRVP